jgi:hypothetical protein
MGMKTKYTHKFDRIVFNNRWKRPHYSRSGDWILIGIGRRLFGVFEYEWVISFFGFDLRIWMKKDYYHVDL